LRNEVLSFQHHLVVAWMPPGEQKKWLGRAVREEWSSNQMTMGLFSLGFTAWMVAALLMGIGVIIDASGRTLNVMTTRSGRKHSRSRR
jgi:hypothetical protein